MVPSSGHFRNEYALYSQLAGRKELCDNAVLGIRVWEVEVEGLFFSFPAERLERDRKVGLVVNRGGRSKEHRVFTCVPIRNIQFNFSDLNIAMQKATNAKASQTAIEK